MSGLLSGIFFDSHCSNNHIYKRFIPHVRTDSHLINITGKLSGKQLFLSGGNYLN